MFERFTEAIQSLFTLPLAEKMASVVSSGSGGGLGGTYEPIYDRKFAVSKSREMYNSDPRIYSVIETLSRDITYGDFSVEFLDGTDMEAAQNEINSLVMRLKLNESLDNWLRGIFVDGESFIELIDDGERITHTSRKEVLTAFRLTDIEDRFFDYDRAYIRTGQQVIYNDLSNEMPEIPKNSITYSYEKAINPRLPRIGNQRNGKPLFFSAFDAWDRLREGEYNLRIQRRLRSGFLRHHSISGANQETLKAYRENTKDNLNDVHTSICDLFTSDNIDIKILKGSIEADQIDDVQLHLETVFTASPVPLTLIGYGQNINRDIVEQKLDQYNRALISWTEFVDRELIAPIIERQLVLAGLYPDSYIWRVVRPSRSLTKVGEISVLSKAILDIKNTGLYNDTELRRIFEHYVSF